MWSDVHRLPFGLPVQSALTRHSTQYPAVGSQNGVAAVAEQSLDVVHVGTQRSVFGLQVLVPVQSEAMRHSTQVFESGLQRGVPTADEHCVSVVHQTQVCVSRSHAVPFGFPAQSASEVHSTQKWVPLTSQWALGA